jgi:hypothetical protein
VVHAVSEYPRHCGTSVIDMTRQANRASGGLKAAVLVVVNPRARL